MAEIVLKLNFASLDEAYGDKVVNYNIKVHKNLHLSENYCKIQRTIFEWVLNAPYVLVCSLSAGS
jgi:hypothetical protein